MTKPKITALIIMMGLFTLFFAACNKSGSTPTATAKAFYDASKAKDVQGIKNALSKKSLAMLEGFSQMGGKSLDDSLKESDPAKMSQTFEVQNEKINGDKATLDIKDENGKWQTVPFVKEDGQWKIALDELMEKAFSQMDSGHPQVSPEKGEASPQATEEK
ncbi:MAG: DUF4878 domain-containing protein [Acidobacteriota bacterium]|nr:DUF4878 domain-containing protein [Acidobacteriota bacterium]